MQNWQLRPKIDAKTRKKLSEYDNLTAQLLFNKGLVDAKNAEEFLNITPNDITDGQGLGDMEKAVARINKAIESKEKIFIHGDFDVDGVTATSILWDYLYKDRGADVLPYIPHKVDEGYGVSEKTLQKFVEDKADLVITVDCGIRDVELVKKFQGNPYDIIITDHHEPGEEFPPAHAVVHPMHPDYKYPFYKNSGAVVAWKLVHELKKSESKENLNWVDTPGADLVAISTICDIMALEKENRAVVNVGLEALRQTNRPGLRALTVLAGAQVDQLDTYHLGFVLGPRLNAAGRLDHAMEAVRLLSTSNSKQAQDLALKLHDLNKKRQEITEEILVLAEEEVAKYESVPNIIIIKGKDWPEGIIGIIAGKMTEKYYRPAIVLSENSEGKVTGSARSIPPFNIIEAIEKSSEGLESYGGHPQAAGMHMHTDVYEEFKSRMHTQAEQLTSDQLIKQINIDAEADVSEITMDFLETLEKFKPFGYGNPKPIFLFKNLKFVDGKKMGQQFTHMRGIFASEDGEVIKAVGFNRAELIDKLKKGQSVDIVGYAEINEYDSNREIQLNIQDTNID